MGVPTWLLLSARAGIMVWMRKEAAIAGQKVNALVVKKSVSTIALQGLINSLFCLVICF